MILFLALKNFFTFRYWSTLCRILKGCPLQIPGSLWSSLLSGTLSCKFRLPWSARSLTSISATQGVSWSPPWFLFPVPGPVNYSGRAFPTWFVSHLLAITVLCYLMSNVLKTIVSYILFLVVSGKRVNLVSITPSWLETSTFLIYLEFIWVLNFLSYWISENNYFALTLDWKVWIEIKLYA